jgi:DNA adenine methylase
MATAKPFLRWAGGKRWLATSLARLLSNRVTKTSTYYEPFLGAGAVFFALRPQRAVLSDLNGELIATYSAVARRPSAIVAGLATLRSSAREYERIRAWRPRSPLERAVRLIYLNHNCFGGLYRENRRGEFNVPFGGGERTHDRLCHNGLLLSVAKTLAMPEVEVLSSDFEPIMGLAAKNDILYCDPTYREVTRRQFDRYGKTVFDWKDQQRLANAATRAAQRGALVLLSSSGGTQLRQLYPHAAMVTLCRRKGLGPNGDAARLREYLFVLDPRKEWEMWSSLGPLRKPAP